MPKSPCSKRIATLSAAVPQSENKSLRKRTCSKNDIPMRNKILLTLLFLGALCGGQTTPTAPGAQTIACPTGPGPVSEGTAALCPPTTSTVPSPETAAYPPGTTPGVGTLPFGVAPAPATNVPPPYKPIGPITTQTEFQIFAEDEAGHPLKVFGRELFDESPTTFAPLDRIPVPADYVIGPATSCSFMCGERSIWIRA